MRRLATLLKFFALVLSITAQGSDAYLVTDDDRKFLISISDAVRCNDTAWIAGQMVYPISVATGKKARRVETKAEFEAFLKLKLTKEVRAKIAEDVRKPLFKNWKGVMVGDGILWFLAFRSDDSKPWEHGILAIVDFAFQPKAN